MTNSLCVGCVVCAAMGGLASRLENLFKTFEADPVRILMLGLDCAGKAYLITIVVYLIIRLCCYFNFVHLISATLFTVYSCCFVALVSF